MEPVGIKEAAETLGVAEVTLRAYKASDMGFPASRWRVSGKEAWDLADIKRWYKKHFPKKYRDRFAAGSAKR